ncbi:MAG: IclR family transcriptional regulator [Lentisphaerae bacterium]|nr:IclR family transcriptional regulator [Lentisphaerota bacterium]
MKEKIQSLENEKYIVPALYRGLNVLEELSRYPRGVTLTEIPGDIPPATLYRILTTLTRLGYVVRDPNDRYRLSRKLLSLGSRAINRNDLVERALPIMRELRDLTGETVLLASLYGTEGVVLAQVESNQAVKVTIQIGHHFPLHSAAPGKAILAYLPEEERSMILEQMVFTRFTESTITDRGTFEKTLQQVRKNGYAFDYGEELEDIRCAAAPLLDENNYPEGAIWISGPASRLPNHTLKKHLKHVIACAEKINAE